MCRVRAVNGGAPHAMCSATEGMSVPRLLGIAGSLRSASYNRRIHEWLRDEIRGALAWRPVAVPEHAGTGSAR